MEIQILPRELAATGQCASHERNPLSGLTARQHEIVQLLLEGCSNKVIARKLGISPNTVKVHIQAIFRELRVHNRMALVVALRPFFDVYSSPDLQGGGSNNEHSLLFIGDGVKN